MSNAQTKLNTNFLGAPSFDEKPARSAAGGPIVAFRQVSILLGTIAGVWLLKEPAYPAKFAGVTTMFAGLILVATG